MEIQNNKEEVPFSHYLALFEKLDPQEAAKRCGVSFEDGCFTVPLLNSTYRIAWPEYVITADREDAFALTNLPCQTFLLRYLLEGRQAALSLGYKTFREMPWGELYITPYTGRCLTRAAFTFGTQVPAFAAACERMWELPCDENLRRVLDSRVAHLKNSAMGSSVGGYATVGAMFVKEFVEETPWIHLDIGGTAWTTECEGIYTKGGIGFGTRMLYETFKVMEKEGTQV